MWDLFILIKIQLPTLDVTEPMANLEKYMPLELRKDSSDDEKDALLKSLQSEISPDLPEAEEENKLM